MVEVSDSVTTRLDRGRVSDEDRAAAARFLERKGFADLLDVLGLADAPSDVIGRCPSCSRRLPKSGVCGRNTCVTEAVR